jgi:glycerol-3-phosphate dehydrogenase
VFGGKLTTYRKLSEHAMSELRAPLRFDASEWTRGSVLPGGDIPRGDFEAFVREQAGRYSFAPPTLVRRLCRAYGTRIEQVLGNAQSLGDLGEELGPQLYEAELQFMRDEEWTRTGADALWRRSKMGLRLNQAQQQRVAAWFEK